MKDWLIKGSFDTPSLAGYRLAGLSALVGLGARNNLSVSVAPDVVARTTRTINPETPTLLEQTGPGNAERVG